MPHAKHAVAATTLVLSGTLNVDNKAATTSTDSEGDTMTMIPVAGQLGALGTVHGFWNETVDAYGDYLGPDTVQLRDPQGIFVVAFNNGNAVRAQHLAGGAVAYKHPERVLDGTGSYARTIERGTIELTTNGARSDVETLTLATQRK
jgi:hypothetical protein